MASCCEGFPTFVGADALDEGGEEEDHVAAFVHDGGAAVGAGDLAGEVVRDVFVRWVIPAEIVVAMGEVDVVLLEDACPLEGGL